MLSVPLEWHDQVVGVLNVQTEEHREFTPSDVDQLSAIADLLAGIVEKGRLQRGGRGAGRAAQGPRPGAQRAHRARDPRAADAARRRPRLHGPAGRRARPRGPLVAGSGAPGAAIVVASRHAWTRSSGWTGWSTRSSSPCAWCPTGRRDLQTIDLARMVDELLGDLGPLLARHRQRITGSRRLHVMADPARLRQVLEHLLENAVKYAPPDTAIELDWRLDEGIVRIEVTDDGTGHPARVAGPDLRTLCAARDGHGTGLGHRPVRGAPAGGIDGRAAVVRAGAVRRRALRARAARRGRGLSGQRRASLIGTRPLRILVVDDDPAMVGAITALVGTEGHQVITAYDGLTAVKRFREERPDLVLLDLAMPGPDGFTVIGQLRAIGQRPGPRRLGRERRGRQGQGAGHRRRRLPRQAVRQAGAAGPDLRRDAPRGPRGDRADRRQRRRPGGRPDGRAR